MEVEGSAGGGRVRGARGWRIYYFSIKEGLPLH